MHCAPNRSDPALMRSGFSTAAVFRETLSAPDFSIRRMSSAVRMPPPTVSGMNTWSAVFAITSTTLARASLLAVMSRKTSSSAP